jgi:hypothetical protein
VKGTLVVSNPLSRPARRTVTLQGRGLTPDQTFGLDVAAHGATRRELTLQLGANIPAGRQVFVLRATEAMAPDQADAFLAIDVEP